MRRLGRQLLFDPRWPGAVSHESRQLRLATIADIEMLVPVHAEMAFEGSGCGSLQGRYQWVFREVRASDPTGQNVGVNREGPVIFKADVVSETLEASYVEGVLDPS
jgi:hypothetical protein